MDHSQGLGGLAHHLHQISIGTVLLQLPAQLQEAEDRITGLLARRSRHHAILLVVGLLDRPAPFGFRDGLGHRIGHVVGIEQRTFNMTGRSGRWSGSKSARPAGNPPYPHRGSPQGSPPAGPDLHAASSRPPGRRIPPDAGPG